MVHHVIIWTLKDEYSEAEKETIKQEIKEGLEGLQGKIPGLELIQIRTEGLKSSTGELMLDSIFEDEASLKAYSANPLHCAVANEKVRPHVKIRSCFDYETR